MKYKVGIIGKFGANENWYDGQTIKTKNLAMLLENTGECSIVTADTCYFRRKNVKLMLDTLKCMLTCKHIFLLVSVNGMNFYLPFLYYLNKITHRRIYHYIIGSELLEMVAKNPKLVKYLNALDANWFEYDSGTRYLESQGVTNVTTLPNFKVIQPVENAMPYNAENGVFRYCTFSRVMEEKGITDAINAIRAINESQGKIVATLDIYGQIEPSYEEKLKVLVAENSDFVTYGGIVDSQGSVEVLKNYYALLFPTYWVGEGLPGTVVDAFAASLPVIATDWNANSEIIEHNKQGIIYPNGNIKSLKDAIEWSINHTDIMAKMRIESRAAFNRYTPNEVLKVILEQMNKK